MASVTSTGGSIVCHAYRREGEIRRLSRLLFVVYFLEVGLVLIVVPWSAFWDRNLFIESYPLVQAVLANNFARGAVSGLGVLNLWAGLSDLAVLLGERRPADERSGGPPAAELSRSAPEA